MRIGPVAVALTAALAACGWQHEPHTVTSAPLSPGSYRSAGGSGYAPADESSLLAVTAQLDRAAGRLVLTLADGSQRTLAFAPRSQDEWQPDCYTMSSHVLEEVADLSPAPLQLESLTFATPLVFAKCGPGRMILADRPDCRGSSGCAFLAFDLR